MNIKIVIVLISTIYLVNGEYGAHSYAHIEHHDQGHEGHFEDESHHFIDEGHHHEEYHAPIDYKYSYGVKDPHTGDEKEAWEQRHGDHVTGSYSLTEPDGTKRIVDYTADKHNGFNAVVKKIGHPHHVHHIESHHDDEHHYSHGF